MEIFVTEDFNYYWKIKVKYLNDNDFETIFNMNGNDAKYVLRGLYKALQLLDVNYTIKYIQDDDSK
jgi:hypothetical protein